MESGKRWLVFVLMLVMTLQLAACAGNELVAETAEPATLEKSEGSEFNLVTLSPKAAERLRVETAAVRTVAIDGQERLVVPYAAIVYGLNGETWLYISPEQLSYVRAPIVVEYIEGERAVLSDGPAVGTEVVTVGVAELLGVDTGVGK